jgi:hypothetical protein
MREMKITCKRWLPALAGLTLALTLVPNSLAQCGAPTKLGHPASWNVPTGRAQLTRAAYRANFREVGEEMPSIVGMWHVVFTAKGNGSAGPPDGTPIDNAVAVWHSDRTEIMNSGRPPQDGNFCLGTWEEVGNCQYKLNHFALGYDTTNAPEGIGKPAGPTHIVEEVTVSSDGKSFTGTFTLDAYDTSFNLTTHIVGTLKGTRITVSSTIDALS